MKSIKRNNGNFWMIGSFLIILILFLLLLSKTPMVMTNDTIQFTEVIACIEALEDDEYAKDLSFALTYSNGTALTGSQHFETAEMTNSLRNISSSVILNVPCSTAIRFTNLTDDLSPVYVHSATVSIIKIK